MAQAPRGLPPLLKPPLPALLGGGCGRRIHLCHALGVGVRVALAGQRSQLALQPLALRLQFNQLWR